jgi:outer membrane protein OmpA-like peptidoglycan-associated protein
VEVRQGREEEGLLWNLYEIAEKDRKTGVYKWSEDYQVTFRRDSSGRMFGVDSRSPVPAVRNVPVFPVDPLRPGDTWSGKGQEVFNLGPTFQIPELLVIDFKADYRYAGPGIIDDREMEVIDIRYSYNWAPDPRNPVEARLIGGDWFPEAVSGEFHQTLWWDPEFRRDYAVDEDFSYTFFMNGGDEYTFRGRSSGRAVYTESLDRSALVKEIEELTDDHVVAQAVPEGVKVALDDIHFVPDREVMLPGEELKLEGIASVLRRYPDRDIMVVGHTAKIPGSGDGRLLSEQRAETVAAYLIGSGTCRDTQIIVRGMGSLEPAGDNATEEGRKQNRRVEIIILEN